MSNFIYNNRNKYQASQFGAFSLYNDTITDGKISFLQYLVHANYTAVFGMPLFQTLVAQGVLQSVASSASLQLSLQPLPYTQTQLNTAVGINVGLIADFVMLAIPWVSASYASYVVREREVKSKHVQMVSGVSIYAYWLGTWIWDFVSRYYYYFECFVLANAYVY
jgi:ATP-binding cassette subfamily A (ABC1) protein 3